MKVAFVSFETAEREYSVRLASGIARDQDTSILLFLPKREAEPYLHLLSSSVDLQLFEAPRLRQLFRQVQMLTRLVKRIKDFNPDVIHLQMMHIWFILLAMPMLRDYRLVLTVHDALLHVGEGAGRKTFRIPQWVHDRGCYLARQRIVHTQQVKELLLQRLSIPSNTVHVVPLVPCFGGEATEHVQEDEHLILFFGRIWEYKGLEYLIRAEPLITSQVPRAKIVIAGVGEDFARYRRMMVHPEQFIVYNEYISDEKRAELFGRASVAVLPYIEASQSGVILVAYHFKKPVVATTVGGLPEMVDHGQTGYLVPPRDPNALAEAIVLLMQNEEMRRHFGENGRRKVDVEWAPAVLGHKTRLVYRQAVNDLSPVTDLSNKQPHSGVME